MLRLISYLVSQSVSQSFFPIQHSSSGCDRTKILTSQLSLSLSRRRRLLSKQHNMRFLLLLLFGWFLSSYHCWWLVCCLATLYRTILFHLTWSLHITEFILHSLLVSMLILQKNKYKYMYRTQFQNNYSNFSIFFLPQSFLFAENGVDSENEGIVWSKIIAIKLKLDTHTQATSFINIKLNSNSNRIT